MQFQHPGHRLKGEIHQKDLLVLRDPEFIECHLVLVIQPD